MAAEKLKGEGNTMFTKGCWAEAAAKYGEYITLLFRDEESKEAQSKLVIGYSNRAETWLKLKKYVQAHDDCERALEYDPTHLKSWGRKARALEGLFLHLDAARTYRKLLQGFTLSASEKSWMKEALMISETKDRQSRWGIIEQDMDEKWEKADPGPELLASAPNLEEYVGPIRIGRTQKMGRGLFVTRNVGEGDLLLVSNIWTSNRFTMESETMPLDNALYTLQQSVEEIVNEAKENLQDLTHLQRLIQLDTLGGPYPDDLLLRDAPPMRYFKPVNSLERGGWRVTDEDRKHPALTNTFDRPFITKVILEKQLYHHGPKLLEISELYVLPSLMNHSCVPNVSTITLNNGKRSRIFRATRSIRAGEELFRAYHNILCPVDERRILHGKQNCECQRCTLELKLLREVSLLNYVAGECGDLAIENENENMWNCSTDVKQNVRTRSMTLLTAINDLFVHVSNLANLDDVKQDWIRASLTRFGRILLDPAIRMLPEVTFEQIQERDKLLVHVILAALTVDRASEVALSMCSGIATEEAPNIFNPVTDSMEEHLEAQVLLDCARRIVELSYGSGLKSQTIFNIVKSYAGRLKDLPF
ncbi:hypothetical protein R1flu_000471 [Riccia fluitans]|uniref:SET domain-containing protein n=1 Tax=Riccia fluitans TaxID=41844 RepID=A0ABD1Y0W5_9MARC